MSVRTVRGSSGPQGATGNTLKRFCSSKGERAPSWSCGQKGHSHKCWGTARADQGGSTHLVMLLKHLLQKLVAAVVKLSAATSGYMEPAGMYGTSSSQGILCSTVVQLLPHPASTIHVAKAPLRLLWLLSWGQARRMAWSLVHEA